MNEYGPEGNTPEIHNAEQVIEELLSEYSESISEFSMTPPDERDKFYDLPSEYADKYMPHVNWENVARESHDPISITNETKIAELKSVMHTALEELKALEEDGDVIELLTAEAKTKHSITIAEQFGPDVVDGKKVIRTKGSKQERYVQVRQLVGIIDEQTRIYEDNQLALITIPGLLLISELNRSNKATNKPIGFNS